MFGEFNKINKRIIIKNKTEAIILFNVVRDFTGNAKEHFKSILFPIKMKLIMYYVTLAIISAVSLKLLHASHPDFAKNSSTSFKPML